MTGLGVAVWAIGCVSLIIAYSVFSQRYYRARVNKVAGRPPGAPGASSWFSSGIAQGGTLWKRQDDPELERLRARATRAFIAFIVFGFLVGPILMRVATALPAVDFPQLSLPGIAGTEGASTERWMALVGNVCIGFLLLWQLNVALGGGPDWMSGRPGDPFRLSRSAVIAGSVLGLCLIPILFAVIWITTAG